MSCLPLRTSASLRILCEIAFAAILPTLKIPGLTNTNIKLMKALLIGASGATGKDLVDVLLHDPAYTHLTIFVRKSMNISHPKLHEVITDFSNLDLVSSHITGDIWFSCLGTTLKAAGSKENQWKIDYEIPLKFGEIAKRNEVKGLVLLSAASANAKSRIFYSSMKGKLEDALGVLSFDPYVIFRPGLLIRKDTDRVGERVAEKILKGLNAAGILTIHRPISTRLLAEKLAKAGRIVKEGRMEVVLKKVFEF